MRLRPYKSILLKASPFVCFCFLFFYCHVLREILELLLCRGEEGMGLIASPVCLALIVTVHPDTNHIRLLSPRYATGQQQQLKPSSQPPKSLPPLYDASFIFCLFTKRAKWHQTVGLKILCLRTCRLLVRVFAEHEQPSCFQKSAAWRCRVTLLTS